MPERDYLPTVDVMRAVLTSVRQGVAEDPWCAARGWNWPVARRNDSAKDGSEGTGAVLRRWPPVDCWCGPKRGS